MVYWRPSNYVVTEHVLKLVQLFFVFISRLARRVDRTKVSREKLAVQTANCKVGFVIRYVKTHYCCYYYL